MGTGGSKYRARAANNPIEMVQHNTKQYEREYRRIEEELRRKAKAEKKAQKMAELPTPAKPFVPKKPEPKFQEADYDVEAKRRMQDHLAWDSQTFVLNQLMLSVQFFDNYEREMWDSVDRNRDQENAETRHVEQHCKQVLLPDRLQEAIDRRIKFSPLHGPQKNQERSLYPQTMYIVHENIEVTNPGDPSNYSILTDAAIYRMEIDASMADAQRHVGYVRLKCVEGIHINRPPPAVLPVLQRMSSATELSDTDESTTSGVVHRRIKYRDTMVRLGDGMKRPPPLQQARPTNGGLRTHRSSVQQRPMLMTPPKKGNGGGTSSGSGSSSTDYDYAYITLLSVRQPLAAAQTGVGDCSPASTTELPQSCFCHEPQSTEDSDEEEDNDDESRIESPVLEMRQFLSSKAFLNYFINVFRDTLGPDMQIAQQQLNQATWRGATIYSDPWEIIPALSAPWPNEAFEWMRRTRDIKTSPITMQQFQWPTPDMVNKVVSFGCLLVPMGFIPKSGVNGQRELEWKIVFPNAERYLENCLSSAQCKVYIVAKCLLQTFVEPFLESRANGFTNEHLRTHLFWQCEMNYAAWPEDYLGETLVRFLNSLLDHIKRQRLPDYFLPKRNLFENIPERVMVDLHKRIFRITENPLMHTMIALRNLRCKSGFAKRFDFKHLYRVMTIDNPLKIINPNFQSRSDRSTNGRSTVGREDDAEDDDGPGALGAIGYHRMAEKSELRKRRKTKKVRFMEAKIMEELERETRRVSVESIDVRFPTIKHMEQLRRVIIYELFINHYVEMARQATTFNSFNQALIYLKQATRLCSLLKDDDRVEQSANYILVIETLHEVVVKERHRDSQTKPQLPQRESFRDAGRVCRTRVPRTMPTDFDPYKNSAMAQGAAAKDGPVRTISIIKKQSSSFDDVSDDSETGRSAKDSSRRFSPNLKTMAASTALRPDVQTVAERIIGNQRRVQIDVHTPPPEDFDYLPRTPVAPLRAIHFNRRFDDSDDTDSVNSPSNSFKNGQSGKHRFVQRNVSASSEDVITAC